MKKFERTILFRHESGWVITRDSGFPSCNYCVFRADEWKQNDNLPPHGVAYCGSLESALNLLFQQLVIEKIDDKSYCASIKDLSKVIEKTRQEFKELLKTDNLQFTHHKPKKNGNKRSGSQTTLEKLERRSNE